MSRISHLIVAVVGPTASGKSDLAVELAQLLPGVLGAEGTPATPGTAEIVGADAMQLYRGMDIGTAKTPVAERRGIAHHQLDVLDVTQEASVARYQVEGRADIAAIHRRGNIAIVAGGSGLYLRALLDVMDFPGTDPAVRSRLEEEAQGTMGSRGLHQRLAAVDPESASRIDPHNARRIIRALEVIELTGAPYSSHMPRREFVAPTVMIGVRRPLGELDERINARAAGMFAAGLVEETRRLIDEGLREGKTAHRATGYAQALAVIDGELSESEAIDSVALATRQLSRRQIKWWRPEPRIHWLDAPSHAGTASPSSLPLVDQAVQVIGRQAELVD